MSTVLLAQYHSEIRSLMVLLLRGQGYDVEVALDLTGIRQQVLQRPIDLLVLDVMFPGVAPEMPLDLFQSGDMGPSLAETPILLTDVNGLLETTSPGETSGADGFFAPRTGRSNAFLSEVRRLLPPPTTPVTYAYAWRLNKKELPSFLYACFLFELNGILTFRDDRIHKSLHFENGWIRSASSSVESDWLGKMLLASRVLTEQALNEVERALPNIRHPIGQEFIARGYLDDRKLNVALNEQYASIVMSVFEWPDAEISLTDGGPNPEPRLMTHPFRLVLDGLRAGFSDQEIDALLPPRDHYLAPTAWTAFRFADVELSIAEQRLLRAIDGGRTLETLIGSASLDETYTKRFLLALMIMRAMLPSPRPEPQPVTFNRQMENGEQALIEQPFGEGERPAEADETAPEQEEEAALVSAIQDRMDARRAKPIYRYLATAFLVLLAALLIFGAYFMCQAKPAAEQQSQGLSIHPQATATTVADQSATRAFQKKDFPRPTRHRSSVARWRADQFRATGSATLST